jgi:hemolysin activation/secretion protein
VGVSYTLDTRDLREYASRGTYATVFAAKHGLRKMSVDYFRYGFSAKRFQPIGETVVLAVRSHASFVGGGLVPPYRYSYFGYEERIRGRFRTVEEGEHLVGGNLEIRIPLLRPMYIELPYDFIPEFSVWRFGVNAAVFADAGKTWYRTEQFADRRWLSGVGMGIHFLLPYSIVARAEWAVAPRGRGELILDLGASF